MNCFLHIVLFHLAFLATIESANRWHEESDRSIIDMDNASTDGSDEYTYQAHCPLTMAEMSALYAMNALLTKYPFWIQFGAFRNFFR